MAFEVINEVGFAIVVPVGLSFYSRLAPRQVQGFMIGVFYLSFFLTNLTVGRLGGFLERMSGSAFWLLHVAIVGAAAVALVVIAIGSRRRRAVAPA